jgi:MoxR-like ATPase
LNCLLPEGDHCVPDVSLEDVLNLFDPGQPLENGQLDTYYVKRPHAPLEPLKRYLEARREPVKVLFSGHRGSGKSTELRRLARDLAGRFFVVTASARSLNPADLQYVDVVFACAAALLREATAEGKPVAVPDGLLNDVEQFLRGEIITEVSTVAP